MTTGHIRRVPEGLWPLWGAGFISAVGESLYQVAIMWMILDLTGSPTATGLIGLSQYLPAVFFGPLAGTLVDRWNRKRVMIVADFARAILVAAIPVLFYAGEITGLRLGMLAFASNLFTTAFVPARDSIVPSVVRAGELTRAGSLLQASFGFAYFTGPMLVALILSVAETPDLFYVNSLTYLVSMACLFALKPRPPGRPAIAHATPWESLRAGFAYAKAHRLVGGLLLITAVDNVFIMGPALVGTPIYVKQHLQRGPEAYAAIQGAFALGMIVGSLLVQRVAAKFPRGRILLWALMFDGITFAPFAFTDNLYVVLGLWFFHSIGVPFILVPRTTLIQTEVPAHYQGRVFSLVYLTVVGLSAVSSALTGILAEVVPIAQLYAIIGVSATVVGALGWKVRELRGAS
ncbi:MFS transporter [candidate division KSB1 bacterium]|nr:MFS transporter [candidate division KSB1 bacterium]